MKRPVAGAVAWRRRAIGALVFLLVPPDIASASDGLSIPFAGREASLSSYEFWTGADATAHAWSVYSGLTVAPFGSLAADGWRLRGSGGYGEYRYDTTRSIGGTVVAQRIRGEVTFADILAGYHAKLGQLTLKAFAGATADLHDLTPFDPNNAVNDHAFGWKAVLEGWLNLTNEAWAQLDLAWASAHDGYASRLRLGYRITPQLSIGLEGGAFGNAESDAGRGGGFLRYEWAGGEISASAGVSGDIDKPNNPYATAVWLTRF